LTGRPLTSYNPPVQGAFILVTKFVKQNPLIAFFSLAYGLSWMVGAPAALLPNWPGLLTFLTAFGPAAAAVIVVGLVKGKSGVEQLIRPLGQWRVGLHWYLVVLFGPALTMVLSIYLYRLLGNGSVHQSMTVSFFVLALVGYSILYTWIFNGSKGSLLLICLLHGANNTTVTYTMLFFKPILEEPLFSLAVLGLFDLLVILIARPKLLWLPPNRHDELA
jgi:hypothetical protein